MLHFVAPLFFCCNHFHGVLQSVQTGIATGFGFYGRFLTIISMIPASTKIAEHWTARPVLISNLLRQENMSHVVPRADSEILQKNYLNLSFVRLAKRHLIQLNIAPAPE